MLRLLLIALLVVALLTTGRAVGEHLPALAARIAALGAWGPVVFIVAYIVATVAFVPGSLLTLAAGALFGLARGIGYAFIAASLGAIAAFLVSRYLARGMIERRIAANARFAALDRAIATQGRKIVFLLRLSPLVPFNLLNYALGLTPVRLVDYMVASVGMLPTTSLYVYYGNVAGDVATLAAGASPSRGAGHYTVLALGLVATFVATTVVTRLARRALREVAE